MITGKIDVKKVKQFQEDNGFESIEKALDVLSKSGKIVDYMENINEEDKKKILEDIKDHKVKTEFKDINDTVHNIFDKVFGIDDTKEKLKLLMRMAEDTIFELKEHYHLEEKTAEELLEKLPEIDELVNTMIDIEDVDKIKDIETEEAKIGFATLISILITSRLISKFDIIAAENKLYDFMDFMKCKFDDKTDIEEK